MISYTSLQCYTQRGTNGSNICRSFSPNSSCFTSNVLASHRGWGSGYDKEESNATQELPKGLQTELMPKHVAVVMDGNRRWATNRTLTAEHGHKAGAEAMKRLALFSSQLGVKVLTVFAFSTENWMRPKEEVDFLMSSFEEVTKSESHELLRHDMQISFIGDKTRLPESLQSLLSSIELSTVANKGMRLLIAINYGGRYDITEACKKVATKVRDGVVRLEDVNENIFEQHLATGGIEFPHPDMVIRTSGEMRISNFMLWQLAYSELWFVNKLFPDFEEADFLEVLRAFQHRQISYGG